MIIVSNLSSIYIIIKVDAIRLVWTQKKQIKIYIGASQTDSRGDLYETKKFTCRKQRNGRIVRLQSNLIHYGTWREIQNDNLIVIFY